MSVRLAYFDAVTDIEAEYYELREKMTRDDTLARLAEAHHDIERKACYAFHNLGIEYLSDKSQH